MARRNSSAVAYLVEKLEKSGLRDPGAASNAFSNEMQDRFGITQSEVDSIIFENMGRPGKPRGDESPDKYEWIDTLAGYDGYLTAGELRVGMVLAKLTSQDLGISYPSHARISQLTGGTSERQVRRAIEGLEEKGLIKSGMICELDADAQKAVKRHGRGLYYRLMAPPAKEANRTTVDRSNRTTLDRSNRTTVGRLILKGYKRDTLGDSSPTSIIQTSDVEYEEPFTYPHRMTSVVEGENT